MKKILYFAVCIFALNLISVFGQPTPVAPPMMRMPASSASMSPEEQIKQIEAVRMRANVSANSAPTLTKFNLDFPGGTPSELVKAVEKATGKPLNVIIPNEDINFQLPAFKLNEITFPQLSETLHKGSFKQVAILEQNGGYYPAEVGYDFRTSDDQPADNSIWYFYHANPPPPRTNSPVQKFYSLEPYLNRGFTVDDITTAIQTGWKMAGIASPPELNYHKETKLLIAFGEPNELDTIYEVLQTLPSSAATYNDVYHLKQHVEQLQKQIDELNKKISAQNSSPEKNSGK